MAVETLAYRYTSQDEVERLFSTIGVSLRVADLGGTNRTTYWTEVTEEATDIVNQYVLLYYDADDLANSRWVRYHATWIALVLLCRRRGNQVPQGIMDRYNEIIADLEMVRDGKMQIPRVPTTFNNLPSMSNMRVDDRFYTRKLRVNPNISVGGTDGTQDLDWWWSYDWY